MFCPCAIYKLATAIITPNTYQERNATDWHGVATSASLASAVRNLPYESRTLNMLVNQADGPIMRLSHGGVANGVTSSDARQAWGPYVPQS